MQAVTELVGLTGQGEQKVQRGVGVGVVAQMAAQTD